MARTHHGRAILAGENVAVADPTIRPHIAAVTGNYVTLRLIARTVVTATSAVVDRIALPMPFRISSVGFSQYGATGTTSMTLRSYNPSTSGTGFGGTAIGHPTEHYISGGSNTIIASGTLNTNGTSIRKYPTDIVAGDNANERLRNIPRGGILELLVTNSGGATIAGGGVCHVTGYFTGHITQRAQHVLPGQSAKSGPAIGYYDVVPLLNRVALGVTTVSSCAAMSVPYDCRVQAISYNIIAKTTDITLTLADTAVRVLNNTTGNAPGASWLPTALAANGLMSQAGVVHTAPGTLTIDARRNLNRGDVLDMQIIQGAATTDRIPIGVIAANVFVWVKGYVRAANTDLSLD